MKKHIIFFSLLILAFGFAGGIETAETFYDVLLRAFAAITLFVSAISYEKAVD